VNANIETVGMSMMWHGLGRWCWVFCYSCYSSIRPNYQRLS